MKYILLKTTLVALSAGLLQLILPWWSIAIAAFAVNIAIGSRKFSSFLSGFLGVGILWAIVAWNIDQANTSLLSTKIAEILQAPNPVSVMLFTALVGGLVGGMGGLTGGILNGSKR